MSAIDTGTLGTIDAKFFTSKNDGSKKHIYLTTAIDVTNYWKKNFPNRTIKQTTYEIRYLLLEENNAKDCVAIYIGTPIIPDELISIGGTWRSRSRVNNINGWRYHQIFLVIDGLTQTCLIHEKCLKYFIWHN